MLKMLRAVLFSSAVVHTASFATTNSDIQLELHFFTDEVCAEPARFLDNIFKPPYHADVTSDGVADVVMTVGKCSKLQPLSPEWGYLSSLHSGMPICSANCELTLKWWVGNEECQDGAERFATMVFDLTAGDTVDCTKATDGGGPTGRCSMGGQSCSRAIEYLSETHCPCA